jgi:hypothetical protein
MSNIELIKELKQAGMGVLKVADIGAPKRPTQNIKAETNIRTAGLIIPAAL